MSRYSRRSTRRRQQTAATLDEVARGSGFPPDQARALLHDLAEVDHLVTILQGTGAPDRFEVKPRL